MLANCHATMKPPMGYNLCTKIWTILSNNQLLSQQSFEWLKLIELSMAIVMASVKDERCFSNMGFMKSKLKNKLTTHLDLVVRLFAHKFFTFDTFPFTIMNAWNATKSCHIVAKAKFICSNKYLNPNLVYNMFMFFCCDVCLI
jgi:hypothetical protein